MTIRKLALILLSVTLLFSLAIVICDKVISDNTMGRIYSIPGDVPYNKVGLLLGTSKFLLSGARNPFYEYRVNAAATLIKAGKIKYIIASGDNSRKDYDEPTDMRDDLIALGVDSSMIYCDYAGFRTFDSIIRLKEIFGQDSVTVISQQFHNERAIYIANRLGISAVGFNAKDVGRRARLRTAAREKLARVKVFVDFWFDKKPRFLGSKVDIP